MDVALGLGSVRASARPLSFGPFLWFLEKRRFKFCQPPRKASHLVFTQRLALSIQHHFPVCCTVPPRPGSTLSNVPHRVSGPLHPPEQRLIETVEAELTTTCLDCLEPAHRTPANDAHRHRHRHRHHHHHPPTAASSDTAKSDRSGILFPPLQVRLSLSPGKSRQPTPNVAHH